MSQGRSPGGASGQLDLDAPRDLPQARQWLAINRASLQGDYGERERVIRDGAGPEALARVEGRIAWSKRRIAQLQAWISERETWARANGVDPSQGDRPASVLEQMRGEIAQGDRAPLDSTTAAEVARTLQVFHRETGR